MSAISTQDRRRVIRLVAAGVVILAFVVLATFAIAASRSDFSVSLGKRSAPTPASAPVELPAVPSLASFGAPLPAPPARSNAPFTVPATSGPTITTETLAPPPALAEDAAVVPPCFLGIPSADTSGGLANLIDIVPIFGSFSPEVFAFLPVMEPLLAAGSPLIPVFEQMIAAGAPLVDVGVPAVQQLGNALFEGVRAFYEPVRPDVLAAETAFATAVAPYVEAITTAPGSECAIAAEGQLAELLSSFLPPANP